MPNKYESKRYFYDSVELPNPGLRSYLSATFNGNSDIYHTPWIKSKSNNKKIIKEFNKIMDSWRPHLEKLKGDWPSLYEFEEELFAKAGPMSVQKPLSQRLKDIDAYYECIQTAGAPVSEEAINATLDKFKSIKGLSIRSPKKTVEKMKLSTNSGAPFFSKRREIASKYSTYAASGDFQYYYKRKPGAKSGLVCDTYKSAAILGWRGQEGGRDVDDVKQRVVWMFPFAVNVDELTCYQPLIEAAQSFNLIPAWVGMDNVDESITRLFDTKSPDDVVICTDFTKFDQHFNAPMQNAAKTILAGLLDGGPVSARWLREVFPIKYNIPLIIGWEQVRFGEHGMASGSGGTNVDETLAHTALQFEAALSCGKELNPNSMCLGDDGVLTFPGITVEDVMRSYTSHGLEMNQDKQYVSTQDCVYLRRWHHKDYRKDGVCVGVYSTARALGRLCMQERFFDSQHWGPKMVALRELSIIENCKHHPLKEEFADFCMERDKFRLGLDIPGFLDNIDAVAKEATDYMPDFLGYTKSMAKNSDKGISDWWIVNYLKSKR
nr:MAG: RNA-dependent RNA polymerase [Porcine picobirnavirus]